MSVKVLSTIQAPVGVGRPLSPDGRRLAIDVSGGRGVTVIAVDAVSGDGVGAAPLDLEAMIANRNGPPLPAFEGVGEAVFSPDSKRLAYVASRGDRQETVVIDGIEGARYGSVSRLMFSPDSRRVAHVASTAGLMVVVDGRASQPFNTLLGPDPIQERYDAGLLRAIAFSPDSRHVAYATKQGDLIRIVIDEQSHEVAANYSYGLIWSPDSSRLAVHIAVNPQQHAIWTGGKLLPGYPSIAPKSMRFSPDSRRLIFTAAAPAEDGEHFVVDNGVAGKRYNYITPESIAISPDGKRMAYQAFAGPRTGHYEADRIAGGRSWPIGEPLAVVDGVERPGNLMGAVFSPDSMSLAYVTSVSVRNGLRDRAAAVEIDGKVDPVHGERVEYLQFSADSRHYAYLLPDTSASPEAQLVVVDGIAFPYPLSGYFHSMEFIAGDTLRAVVSNDECVRVVELKVVPDVALQFTTAPGAPASAEAQRVAAQLRRIADVAGGNEPMRDRILGLLPYVYARLGAKNEALQLMHGPRTAERMIEMFGRIAFGQMNAGDKAGANVTAREALAAAMQIENVRLPENSHHLLRVATIFSTVGDLAEAARTAALAGRVVRGTPASRPVVQRPLDARRDPDAALTQAQSLSDPAKRVAALTAVAEQLQSRPALPRSPGWTPLGPVGDPARRAVVIKACTAALDTISDPRFQPPQRWWSARQPLIYLVVNGETDRAIEYLGDVFGTTSSTGDRSTRQASAQAVIQAMLNARDHDSAAKAWLLLGDPAAAAEAHLCCGDKASAQQVAKEALARLSPLTIAPADAGRLTLELTDRIALLRKLGVILGKVGDEAGAASALSQSEGLVNTIGIERDRVWSLREVGVAQSYAGLDADALRTFTAAAEIVARANLTDAQRANSLTYLSIARGEAGDPSGAKELLILAEPLMAAQPGASAEWRSLMWAAIGVGHFRKHEPAEAEKAFARAMELTPPRSDTRRGYRYAEIARMRARAGDAEGTLRVLGASDRQGIDSQFLYELPGLVFDAGNHDGALAVAQGLKPYEMFGGRMQDSALVSVAWRIFLLGNLEGAFAIIADRDRSIQNDGIDRMVLAAAEAGRMDLALDHIHGNNEYLTIWLVNARLAAQDRDGARRIIERAAESLLSATFSTSRTELNELPGRAFRLAEFMIESGIKEPVLPFLEAVRVKASPSRTPQQRQWLDSEIARIQVHLFDFDAGLAWAATLPDHRVRASALAVLVEQVLRPYADVNPQSPNAIPAIYPTAPTTQPTTRPAAG